MKKHQDILWWIMPLSGLSNLADLLLLFYSPCFPAWSSSKTTAQYLLGQELFSVLFRLLNHSYLLHCDHSLMLFNNTLFPCFTAETLFSNLPLHIHLTILALFLSRSTGQVSVLLSITLCTEAKYNLNFPLKDKSLLFNKVNKFLNSR